jgi:flagellar biosynthetic protein FliQ
LTPDLVIDLGRQAIQLVLLLSAPPLLAGLLIGGLVGLFQAATQIHEVTLSFIPKILVVFAVLFFLMPWMMKTMLDFTITLFSGLATYAR